MENDYYWSRVVLFGVRDKNEPNSVITLIVRAKSQEKAEDKILNAVLDGLEGSFIKPYLYKMGDNYINEGNYIRSSQATGFSIFVVKIKDELVNETVKQLSGRQLGAKRNKLCEGEIYG